MISKVSSSTLTVRPEIAISVKEVIAPIIQKAATLIRDGAIGDVRVAQATCWFYKPDDYFETAPWRTKQGAGPISVNLVHDIDLIRYLCGEVVSVQAQTAPSRRGFENEERQNGWRCEL